MRRGRIVEVLFGITVVVKGIDGVLEVIGGVLLFVVDPHQLYNVIRILTQHELSEDPQDPVANYFLSGAQHLSTGTRVFAAVYLLAHGAVKAGLVTALLLRKLRAYPVAILAFLLFLAYQLYRYSHTNSPELMALSILDVFVIVLTWLEYRRLRASTPVS